jgi:hypothetical protein
MKMNKGAAPNGKSSLPPQAVVICLLFGVLGWIPSGTAGEASLAPRQLRELATLVARSDYAAQQDFAWIALSELTATYEQVLANSAARLPQSQRARRKLYSWRSGTQDFVDSLQRLLARLDGSVNLRLRIDETGPPVLYIDQQPVVLSGPELGAARLMERRIFDAYCAIYDCAEILPQTVSQSPRLQPDIDGRWWLEDYGRVSYRTTDGLICRFRAINERALKQQVCERIAAELRALARALREAQLAGHRIDWNGLRIESLAAGRGQRLLLRPGGAYLRLPLPSLAATGQLGEQLRYWLQRRVESERAQAEIPGPLLRAQLTEAMPR